MGVNIKHRRTDMKRTKYERKWSRFIVFSLVLLQLVVCGGQALAANYLGEFCWKINDPVTTDYVIGKFAVTDVGDGHYSLNGTFTDFDNNVPTETNVAHGNAEIIDSMIVVTLVNTFYVSSEEYGFSMINFQLNPSTLSGTFRTIDTAYQFSSDEITKEYGEGPVEFLPNCQ
jgi:hypothetical protein